MTKKSSIALASAVAGALALTLASAGSAVAQYKGPLKFKCYGVAKAGQGDCANAAGTHSCAGQNKANYDGGDWKAVADAAACTAAKGQAKPFKGMNKMMPGG